jgi:methionyl-tRNA formyltransferase
MKLKKLQKSFCEVRKNKRFKVLFFGNDEISLPTLAKLREETYKTTSFIENIGIITTPLHNKKSTQAVFHNYLSTCNFPKFELNPKDIKQAWSDLIPELNNYNIGIIASFGKMVPGAVIKQLSLGAYVMHPSLLPKYRGAAPIQHTLLNKDKESGISLVEASIGKFDAGGLILQKRTTIEPFYRFRELALKLADMGGEAVIEFLYDYDNLKSAVQPQDETKVSEARLITDPQFVYLDFVNKSAEDIMTTFRAFQGSQLTPFMKLVIKEKERLMFFDNLFIVTQTSDIYKQVLSKMKINKSGSIIWDTKTYGNNLYIKSNTDWVVTTKVKFDCTDFQPVEQVVKKILMNKRYIDKTETESFYSTLPAI